MARICTRSLFLAAASAAALAACTPEKDVHGMLPDKELVAEIKPGQTRQEDVTRILGTPSATATFDKETWYYIGEKTETTAFFKPDVLEHKVLVVRFTKDGVVEEVEQVDAKKDGKAITPVARETPTKGKELTLIQQLVGNVGRFNKDNKDTGEGP
jgi:outer membrane protein assembly factor BamE (lipoprotein component of BamABCDE complex)